MTVTWTDNVNFTNVSGSILSGGSVWPVLDNFDDNSLDTDNWALVGSNVAEQNQCLEITGQNGWDADGIIWKASSFTNTNGNFVRFKLAAVTGMQWIAGFGSSASALTAGTGAYVYFNASGNIYKREDGAGTLLGAWSNGVTYTITLTCTATNTFSITIDGGVFSNESLGSMSGSNCDYFQMQSYETVMCAFDDIESNALGNTVAQFTVHDSGQTYQDAGESSSWDLSEYTPTLTGSPTVTYAIDTSGDSGHTPSYGSELTLAQLQATANTDHRYLWMRVTLTGTVDTTFDALAGDAYVLDVTPPAVPSTTKFSLFETDNYALIWVEPDDADFDHCELKRVVDSTTTYLAKNGSNLPEWQASPSTYWTLADSDAAMDWVKSAYVDEDVSGTSIVYYVRSVDTTGNASAWTLFTAGVGPNAPTEPALAVADNGDGTVTFTVSDADAGTSNVIYTCPAAGGSWSERATVAGNGESAAVTLAAGWYWCKVESEGGGGTVCGAVIETWVADPDGAQFSEVRTWWRGMLTSYTPLVSELSGTDAIRMEGGGVPAETPTVLLSFDYAPFADAAPGEAYTVTVWHRLAAYDHATLDALTDALDALMAERSFTTTSWLCRRILRGKDDTRATSFRETDGGQLLERTVAFSFRLFQLESEYAADVTLMKDTTRIDLPAPLPGSHAEAARVQSAGTSAGGTAYVYDAGIAQTRRAERFEELTAQQKSDLETFFHARAGRQETFSYTDASGTEYTARFDTDTLDFKREGSDIWQTDVPLLLEA